MTDFDRKHAESIRGGLTKTLADRKKKVAHKMGYIEADMHNWKEREKRLHNFIKKG